MEGMHNMMEKSFVSAILAAMLGLGVTAFFMGIAGVSFASVNVTTLLLGYLAFCTAIWFVFMFPYMKKS